MCVAELKQTKYPLVIPLDINHMGEDNAIEDNPGEASITKRLRNNWKVMGWGECLGCAVSMNIYCWDTDAHPHAKVRVTYDSKGQKEYELVREWKAQDSKQVMSCLYLPHQSLLSKIWLTGHPCSLKLKSVDWLCHLVLLRMLSVLVIH